MKRRERESGPNMDMRLMDEPMKDYKTFYMKQKYRQDTYQATIRKKTHTLRDR